MAQNGGNKIKNENTVGPALGLSKHRHRRPASKVEVIHSTTTMSEEERIEAAEAEVSVFTRLERRIMNRRNEFDLLFEWIHSFEARFIGSFQIFFLEGIQL